MLIGSFFLALNGTFAKISTEQLSAPVTAFYQFVLGTLFISPFVFRKGLSLLKTNHPYLHLTRDISGLFAFYFLYLSLKTIPLIDAIVLNNTTPLFVPLVIWVWFKKHLHWTLWIALFIGFVGIFLILRPEEAGFVKPGALLALLSGVGGAITLVTMRRMIVSDKAETITFYYFVFCIFGFALIISLFYAWAWPLKHQWWPIVGMAISLPLMQYFIALSTHYASAPRVVPFLYVSIVFSGLFGWWLWKETPSWFSLLGTLLVIGGAILSLFVGRPKVPQEH